MKNGISFADYVLWYGACCLLLFEIMLIAAKVRGTTRTFASQNISGMRIWFLLWVVGTCLTPGWRLFGIAVIAACLYDIAKYALDLFDPDNEFPLDAKVARVVLVLSVVLRIP